MRELNYNAGTCYETYQGQSYEVLAILASVKRKEDWRKIKRDIEAVLIVNNSICLITIMHCKKRENIKITIRMTTMCLELHDLLNSPH